MVSKGTDTSVLQPQGTRFGQKRLETILQWGMQPRPHGDFCPVTPTSDFCPTELWDDTISIVLSHETWKCGKAATEMNTVIHVETPRRVSGTVLSPDKRFPISLHRKAGLATLHPKEMIDLLWQNRFSELQMAQNTYKFQVSGKWLLFLSLRNLPMLIWLINSKDQAGD